MNEHLEEQTNQPEEQPEVTARADSGGQPEFELPAPEPAPEIVIANWDAVLAEPDLDDVYVALPKPFVGGIRVRPLTMAEIQSARSASKKRVHLPGNKVSVEMDDQALTKRFVLMAVAGPPITPLQYDAMMQKNWHLLEEIVNAVNKVNGFGEPEEKAEKVVEAEFRG